VDGYAFSLTGNIENEVSLAQLRLVPPSASLIMKELGFKNLNPAGADPGFLFSLTVRVRASFALNSTSNFLQSGFFRVGLAVAKRDDVRSSYSLESNVLLEITIFEGNRSIQCSLNIIVPLLPSPLPWLVP
jgi:hypothetical protein